jgi:nucleoside-diphosphate-sugar epimerase
MEQELIGEEALEERLSRPGDAVRSDLARGSGDLVVLGASGKMGPTLVRMARRALPADRAVIAVARFSDPASRAALDAAGARTIPCDLLERRQVDLLPDAGGVIFMAGQKFGTSGAEASTWAANTVAPACAAERYRGVPAVVFSTGNIYPFTERGAVESTPPAPLGEYAQSALGRERVWEHYARAHGTPVTIYRLNYAVELRYGVLLEIALAVRDGRPVDLRMGRVNVIWQGDANAAALRCLAIAKSPPEILNVTGPETLAVRDLAARFGELLGRPPRFEGAEEPRALLSNASKMTSLFGPPEVSVDQVVAWIAAWIKGGGRTLGKPSHFETRDGRF